MSEDTVGARWVRVALQVNPYSYQGKNQPSESFASEDDYNKALLDECESLDIGIIAITDHWTIDSASELMAAAQARGIVALPGFEANSSEGVHLLIIFDSGTTPASINAAIGACGVEPGCANGATGNSFKEILDVMTEREALVIPAHANVANGGMLTGRTGQPLIEMVNDPRLHAIAITPSQAEGTDQEKIVNGVKPYDRMHPLSVIHADDVVHPDRLKESGATSWFKVSSPSLDSLKLAVRTPETRVALSNPSSNPRTLIREISWTGGFLDGVTIPISSDLTALIGGRGTGKSTVIESLRYALGLSPIGGEAAKDHKSIVDNVVRSGTIIKVAVETVTPSPRSFTIQRVVPDPPVVLDASGTATNQTPLDVIGQVEVFGQHELAELANDPSRIAEMVQRLSGTGGPDPDHQETQNKLATNREQLTRAEDTRAALQEELDGIPRLEEQIQQFEETDLATRLADLKSLDRDEAIFAEATDRVKGASEALDEISVPQLEGALTASFEGLEGSKHQEALKVAADATTRLAAKLKSLLDKANEAIASTEREISTAKQDWESDVKEHRDGHAAVLRKLHEDGLEPDKYLATTKALDDLKAKQPRLHKHDETVAKLLETREQLLQELGNQEGARLETLHEAVRSANSKTGGVVIVRPAAASDREHILSVIKDHVSGQRTQINAAVDADSFSPRELAKAIRQGEEKLNEIGIKGAQATNLVNAGEPLCRHLEELSVGYAVEVLLNISSGGGSELRRMEELSKGQRATALLLLLLGDSTAPLMIDQPEDDLDNRFVYDGVVQNLRKLKGARQIIASTHNANVPVLGDAELIVALEGDGQHGKPAEGGIGSLDDASIRATAENLLEGGSDAFKARQHLYGF